MNKIFKSLTVLLVLLFSISTVSAKTLTERLADGHKLRLGLEQQFRGLMLEMVEKL